MASDKEKLEHAKKRIKRIDDRLDEVKPKRLRRYREHKEDQVKRVDERGDKAIKAQKEARKDLDDLEEELEDLHKENDDPDSILGDGSDAEIKLVKEIRELEKEIADRHKRIGDLKDSEKNFRDKWDELKDRTKSARTRQKRLKNRKDRTKKLIDDLEEALDKDRHPQTGTGPWGGSMSVVEREVVPLMLRHGPITSRKRSETYGNPTSDHHTSQTSAYAADCGTANNYRLGQEIRSKLDEGAHRDYENFYFTRSGKQFRGQTICGTHGTGPHTHNGVRS